MIGSPKLANRYQFTPHRFALNPRRNINPHVTYSVLQIKTARQDNIVINRDDWVFYLMNGVGSHLLSFDGTILIL